MNFFKCLYYDSKDSDSYNFEGVTENKLEFLFI